MGSGNWKIRKMGKWGKWEMENITREIVFFIIFYINFLECGITFFAPKVKDIIISKAILPCFVILLPEAIFVISRLVGLFCKKL